MLSRTAEYALRAVVLLGAEAGRLESAMCSADGLVRSQSGPGGGYSLARSPDEITILDVVNAVSPLERIHHCPLGLKSHTSLCPLHKELDKAYAATEAAFASVTIGQLLRSTSKIVPLCEV